MTAQELLNIARESKPNVKYVTNDKQDAIGAWVESMGRYVIVAAKIIGNKEEWVSMPYELLVNGKPIPMIWID